MEMGHLWERAEGRGEFSFHLFGCWEAPSLPVGANGGFAETRAWSGKRDRRP